MTLAFRHPVLGCHEARYFLCSRCEFVAARPADWLPRAYSAALAMTDTGVAARNYVVSEFLARFAWLAGLGGARGLDIGGGHGLLVRLLRDRGLDFRWADRYAENLLARGFEDDGGRYEWVTAVEVFEHLPEPRDFFVDVCARYRPQAVFFTTEVKRAPVPPEDWWYWAFETGQHIGFASARSLEFLARSLGYSLTSVRSFHLLHGDRRLGLAFRLAAAAPLTPVIGALARRALGSLAAADFRANSATLRDRFGLDKSANPPSVGPSGNRADDSE